MEFRTRAVVRRVGLVCALGLASILLFGPTSMTAQGSIGSIIWSADHEVGTTADWWSPEPPGVEGNNCGGEYNNAPATSQITPLAHAGRYGLALRVPTMNTGDSLGVRLFRWCESQRNTALYYSAWYFLPERVAVDWWWHIMQWKSDGSFNAKFALAVANRPDGRMYVGLGRGDDSGGGFWGQSIKDVPVGQWFHLEAFYKKSADATGQVTVWQDGVQIIDVANVQTANSADLAWAVINYGQYTTPSDVTLYVDDAAISTTRVGPGVAPTATPTQTATSTPTAAAIPTATPLPVSCSPRPPVVVSSARGAPGHLDVQVAASTPPGSENNRLRQLRFVETVNAVVDVRGRSGAAGTFTVDMADRPQRTSFTVRRVDASRGSTVKLAVVDDCDPWPTFVGGGVGAF